MNDFNRIAPVYDLLKRLVFWGRVEASKKVFLDQIKPGSKVLIIGGGSGQILEYLDQLELKLYVDYVEQSERMVRKAMARKTRNVEVIFYQQDVLIFGANREYDVVIANYILDLFGEENLGQLLERVKNSLDPQGLLLVADFQLRQCWHQVLSYGMHVFFRYAVGLESKGLKDLDKEIREAGWVRVESVEMYGGFVLSSCYRVRA